MINESPEKYQQLILSYLHCYIYAVLHWVFVTVSDMSFNMRIQAIIKHRKTFSINSACAETVSCIQCCLLNGPELRNIPGQAKSKYLHELVKKYQPCGFSHFIFVRLTTISLYKKKKY